MKNYVYLVPLSNGTYVPYIEPTAPSDEAILLTKEGDYPVDLGIINFDVYGCGETFERTINSRAELLNELLLRGQMCCALAKLWDYDVDRGYCDDIGNLFDTVYHTRMDAIRGNGNINSKFAFVDSVSFDEYCACWCPKRDCAESFSEIR